ncbi:TetR/AcrR family transcriptional regulator [Brucella pseudogrignonensis]|uniref:AcrR family transcriptional regulator n=1 Tax=Brucella pseudogrignonensis TaxID=419475 RepID=A0ABU1MBS9_9HYPH|nr:TetR/AcrR family transcriptional regulator [Brucella pseudogrignonensis]MDR6433496.1 AcrR family transcriptional regulator [Brucella pseudogrignonensis]
MARPREIDHDRVLDAAEAVMVESEGRGFTLDAVAERAGVSKGGLVYAFASKDELIAAALARELHRFTVCWNAKADPVDTSPIAMLNAYVAEIQSQEETHLRTASLLMTALSNAPEVSEPARKFYRSVFTHFDGSTQRGRDIRQAILAIEGLFFLRGLGLIDPDHEEWLSVVNHAEATLRKSNAKTDPT